MHDDNPVMRYLKHRALDGVIIPEDIRYHPAMLHPATKKKHPCMVALYRDAQGNPCAIHRTYLTPQGEKIQGEGINPKLMLGSSRGCALRLAPIAPTIGLTEGIENALSVMKMTGVPCWAVGSASGLGNVQLPELIREVLIFRDNDSAGINASEQARSRFLQQGCMVRIIAPQGYKDFNERLMQNSTILEG
ncbi:MAG: hypothetical protein EAZ52_05315 [Alphaproteobacteria bacterium]|nr:MAG: hypothetical protein EAZ52_05315 [Alphaproteobacteria bacterium]